MTTDWEVLAPQCETLVVRGQSFEIRELEFAADVNKFRDSEDGMLHLLIACVYKASGDPLWSDADLPLMKKLSKPSMNKFIAAALRVNGGDAETSAEKPLAQSSTPSTS
jgi:hypothetical protein